MKMYRAMLKNGQAIVTVFAEGSGPSLGEAISNELNRPTNPSRYHLWKKWIADGMLTEEVKKDGNMILSDIEAKAAGWYFGLSNLAMNPPSPAELIKKHGENWSRLRDEFNYHLQSQVESDEMYDGAWDEIEHWISKFKEDDSWCLKEWEKAKGGER
jgi:hypothetical protein